MPASTPDTCNPSRAGAAPRLPRRSAEASTLRAMTVAATVAAAALLLIAAVTVAHGQDAGTGRDPGTGRDAGTGRVFVVLRSASDAAPAAAPGEVFLPVSLREKALRWSLRAAITLQPPSTALRKGAVAGSSPLGRILLLSFPPGTPRDSVIADFASDPAVEYAQAEHLLRVDAAPEAAAPDDSAWASQWGMRSIGIEAAWAVSTGTGVRVGIIDTGIDPAHPDLIGQIWINAAEDANRNGRYDPWPAGELRDGVAGDFDGIDGDGNGFIDDVAGYDFVDQTTDRNTGGDSGTPDGDVTDEMGHGTAVAGIIGATANNGIGIAGVAPGARLMVLRAFDSRGIGSEGDVARALAYAVATGADIVNMSFGDVAFSRVLRDVIRYASTAGLIMPAAAGNSQSDELHYPSAYDETISVAASTSDGYPAGFSNYGSTIDIAAPGQDIVTTQRGGGAGAFSGTSASTPFVTGVAALVKAAHPAFSAEEIRGILISSAREAGERGWDSRYGAGLLDAGRALALDAPSVVRIATPRTDFGTSGDRILIAGTAASPFMKGFALQYGVGRNPSRWFDIIPFQERQAIDDTLAEWVLPEADTTYTIRLSAQSAGGQTLNDQVVVHRDRTPPEFLGIGFIPAIDGRSSGAAVGFITGEPTLGRAWYRIKGSQDPWSWTSVEGSTSNNLFETTTHDAYLGADKLLPGNTYEIYFSAVNAAGLESTARNKGANFEITIPPPIAVQGFQRTGPSLSLSRIAPFTTDFNGNGRPELLVNDLRDNGRCDVVERSGSAFASIGGTAIGSRYPRGAGDLGRDGAADLLVSWVRHGYLFSAPASAAVPSAMVWADSSAATFWPVTVADVNGDGEDEALAVINDSTVGVFRYSSSGGMQEAARIVNPTAPDPATRGNAFSAPRAAIGDFNGNGRTDLLFGDADGDFFITESNGNAYPVIWASEDDYQDASDLVAAGDFDGDGRDEFAIGFRTLSADVIPFWFFGIYRLDGQNKPVTLWSAQFYGIEESAQAGSFTRIQNSLSAGNVDADAADELIITTYPELYVIDFDASTASFGPVWTCSDVNTNAAAIADFDGNGTAEFAVATTDSVVFFEKPVQYAGPEPVRALTAVYDDPQQLRLSWNAVSGIASYNIYRGSSEADMTLFGTLGGTTAADAGIEAGKTYLYAIASIDSARQPAESPRTYSRVLHPHDRPATDSAAASGASQLVLRVSQDMGSAIPHVEAFLIDGAHRPVSVALLSSRSILLTFAALAEGEHGLTFTGLRDGEGIPFDERERVSFTVTADQRERCFIEHVRFVPPRGFDVQFNRPVDPLAASMPANYEMAGIGTAASARPDTTDPSIVHITMGGEKAIGATGREFILTVRNVLCTPAIPVETGAGGSAGVILNRQTLDDMFVFPNPLKPGDGQDFITFANLTPRAVIRVYTLSGRFVAEVTENDGNGGVAWNLTGTDGERITSGVYFYYATGTDNAGLEVTPRKGKFAVVR